MKYSIKKLAVFAFAALATACHSQQPSGNGAASAPGASEPGSRDIALCEQITQLIYETAEADADMMNVVNLSTQRFGALLKAGITMPNPETMSYIDYNIIQHTHDEAPTISKHGPGVVKRSSIEVPVVLQFKHYPPYPPPRPITKTWVFSREDGKWRVSDVATAGAEFGNGSLAADLDAHF